ncbi:MAG TPA: tetratricopeptide repeat protein, partial [Methylomirabilota bacterium]|nr:tetratricopeptide repeat protein [Methylomirabilota bacterium]
MAETLRIMTLAAAVALSACQGGGLAGLDDDREPAGLVAGTVQMTLGTAKTQFRENNFALAEKSFQEVLKRDPSHVEAWLGLAASYDRLGRYDLADAAYDRVISVG